MIPIELWFVVATQMVLGFLDVAVHHELVARLPWRSGAAPELRLHGVRNLIYGGIFLCLGWLVLHGWTVAILAVLLAVEVVITVADWLVEDGSRRLPATERVLHGLLAINFGVLLALLVPVMWDWSGQPAAIAVTDRGVWSWLASVAAVGVVAMGIRDLAAAHRVERFRPPPPVELGLQVRKRWLVTGATGFVGRRLTEALAHNGQDVTILTRDSRRVAALQAPFRAITTTDDIADDDRIDVIVHLAGESVAGGPWTPARRERIERSRPEIAERLGTLVERLSTRPEALISASAVGWYGDRGDEGLDEDAAFSDCFSHRSCQAAEEASAALERLGVRVVMMRIGLVLGREDGLLARLLTPFDLCLGARLGSGAQWMSWIERDDLVRLIVHAASSPSIRGPLNAVTPNPVTNREFTKALGHAMGRHAWFALPRMLLVGLLGDMARELMLASQRVIPAKAAESGFEFRYPAIDEALDKALA